MIAGQSGRPYVCLFVMGLLLLQIPVSAQQKKSAAAVDSALLANALHDRQFIFVPQQMMPMAGRMRTVTPDFSIKLNGDTLISYLPYVGRSYLAPVDASKGPLDFTTTVTYDQQSRKKGGWTIILKPIESMDVQQYVLTVFTNGSTSLQVASTNRQPISYNGYLKPVIKQ
ncbi:protein of unknown function [Chitinophaga costaii]|uniref:DUF4251 domain-containing protein n=1 Tax=Chitinophaga costaii TaxID=1335309 RepID=A0A1C4EIK1_9BACT|nr:DUF4251 domain-containing protein [Chitinophaga costaii]PUZ23799.1 DUF4251 domain-containing protein [Chitinophaga costaii]SCC43417.1 protein of unknown function [Chitinophaga costaii]